DQGEVIGIYGKAEFGSNEDALLRDGVQGIPTEKFPNLISNIQNTALSGVMRYTTGEQDAHPTRVLLLKFVPHSNGICCI
ncbi:MAG: hypothetical protein ACKO86_19520, partial [Dolichospermum sp.]